MNYYGLDGGLKYLIENAKQFSKPFLFTVQAHKWDRDPDQHYVREPSAYEIKAMTNLAVCYGAKGISYYLYSHPSNDPTVLGFYYTDTGLPRDTDDYGYPKWETIKQLNQKLASIGNELLSLDWEGAKSWSNGNTAGNWIGIISNISTNVPSETGYVETSHSKIQDVDYIFVVNRRTLPTDQRTITVTIDKASSIYNNWNITEIGASNSLTVGKTGSFEFSYEPGEGKLFKLEPVVIAGGNLIYNEIISSDIELHGDLTIESGVTLTVNADYNCYGNITIKDGGYIKTTGNGKMFFNNHKRIIVEGTAVIIGEPLNKIELDFIAPHHTNGINVKNGGELAIYYSFIKNSRNGITVDPGGTLIEVAEVDFEDCSDHCINIAGPNSSNCWIHYNTFTNSNCAISATNLGDIYIAYNTVQDVEQGIYLSNVTSPLIMNNTMSSTQKQLPGIFLESCSGGIRENTISGFTNGIHLGNSSPDIGGNEITNNLYHGIYVGAGSLPRMDARLYYDPPNYYPVAGYNDIWENGGTTIGGPPDNDGSEIFFNSSNAVIQEGCNSVYDDRSGGEHPYRNTKLLMNGISFGGQITIHAEFNYWSDNPLYPLEERFGNLTVYYEPFLEDPCEIPVGGGGGEELFVKSSSGEIIDTLYPLQRTVGSLSNTDLLYAVAEEKFISADYEGAEVIYNQITNGNDSLKVKLPAYTRLYDIGKLSSKPESYFNNLNNVYSSLVQSTNDSLMINIFSQLGSLSLVGKEEYIQAIEEFDDVIQQNPGSEKAVYAEIDALTTSLLIEGEDSTLQKGRLGKYLIKNPSDYSSRIDGILRKHFGNGEQKTEEETIPTEYTLYQNYPNPFNPLTTIKYDLPSASNISLIIYDILGRKVKELVNTKQQAGRYEIQFNASNLASGVYVYQLIADKYISSKKMILLK